MIASKYMCTCTPTLHTVIACICTYWLICHKHTHTHTPPVSECFGSCPRNSTLTCPWGSAPQRRWCFATQLFPSPSAFAVWSVLSWHAQLLQLVHWAYLPHCVHSVHVHTYACMYMYRYMYVCMCIHAHVHMHACMYVHNVHVCMYVHVHVCVYMHMCTCMHVHVHVCVYIHVHVHVHILYHFDDVSWTSRLVRDPSRLTPGLLSSPELMSLSIGS